MQRNIDMPRFTDYDKIFISHYGKIASNTLAESLASITKKKRTSIKCQSPYDEFILTTGLTNIPQTDPYIKMHIMAIEAQKIDKERRKQEEEKAKKEKLLASYKMSPIKTPEDKAQWFYKTTYRRHNSQQLANPESITKNVDINKEKKPKILVITICRNLVNRLVSMYFQIHEQSVMQYSAQDIIRKIDFRAKSFFKLDQFPDKLVKDLKLDFDLYKELEKEREKEKESKYFFREGFHIDFLLLKYEFIREWPRIIQYLFGLDEFILINRNLSTNKAYAALYARVLDEIKNDASIQKVYETTRHCRVLNL